MTLGAWIKQTRLDKKMDANECALRAGMSPTVWSRWETDQSRRKGGLPSCPTPKTIDAIARGLDVDPEDVFKATGLVKAVDDSDMRLAKKIGRHLKDLPPTERARAEELLEQDAVKYRSLLLTTAR